MPSHEGDQALRFLHGLVASIQATLRRRETAAASLWATAAALAALAGLLALDAAAGLPGAARLGLYLGAAACGAAGVGAAAARARRRQPTPAYVARLIESQRPELKNALTTFLELRSDPREDPSMAVAVGRRAARILSRDDFGTFLPPASYRRPATATAVAAAMLGAGLWLAQGVLFAPWVPAARGADGTLVRGPYGPRQDIGASGTADSALVRGSDELRQEMGAGGTAEGATARGPYGPRGESDPPRPQGEAPGQGMSRETRADGTASSDVLGGASADSLPLLGGSPDPPRQEMGAGGTAEGATARGGSGDPPRTQPDRPRTEPDPPRTEPDPMRAASDSPGKEGGSPREQADAPGQDMGQDARREMGGGGSPSKRPGTAADEPPLPRRDPGDDFPKRALDTMRQTRRLMGEEGARPRDAEAEDAFLGRMGVGNAELRRFVTAWPHQPAAAPRAAETGAEAARPRDDGSDTGGEVLRPAGGPEARPVIERVNLAPGGRQDVVQAMEARVSPRLRSAVEAYFEALRRLAADRAAKDAKP